MQVIRLLSWDGGGIRGLFSATFLEKFCNDAGINGNELWKYFDIICGTSIGGIQEEGLGASSEEDTEEATQSINLIKNRCQMDKQ